VEGRGRGGDPREWRKISKNKAIQNEIGTRGGQRQKTGIGDTVYWLSTKKERRTGKGRSQRLSVITGLNKTPGKKKR